MSKAIPEFMGYTPQDDKAIIDSYESSGRNAAKAAKLL